MRLKRMDSRCTFECRDLVNDKYGNVTSGDWLFGFECWGRIERDSGDESLRAGRLENSAKAVLSVRATEITRRVTTSDRVWVDGEIYNIRDVNKPLRSRVIEMVIEEGVAT